MFFLVPYSLIDREDLSVIQKMCILYLARHYDERGCPQAIDEEELAQKLRVTTGEIRLNLEVLVSKGILAAEGEGLGVTPENAKEIIIKDAVFGRMDAGAGSDDLELLKKRFRNATLSTREKWAMIDEFIPEELFAGDAFSDEEAPGREALPGQAASPEASPSQEGGEAPSPVHGEEEREEDEKERELNELLLRVGDVEKRIRERASRLRVKVRRKKGEALGDGSEAGEERSVYRRRKSDLIPEQAETSLEESLGSAPGSATEKMPNKAGEKASETVSGKPSERVPEGELEADEIEALKAALRSIEVDVEEGEEAELRSKRKDAPEKPRETETGHAVAGRQKPVRDAYAFYEAGADGKMHLPREFHRTKEAMEANEMLELLASSGKSSAREKSKRSSEGEMPSMRRQVLGEEQRDAEREEGDAKKRPNPRFVKASSVYQQNAAERKKRKVKTQDEKEV